MAELQRNLAAVRRRIEGAGRAAGRDPAQILLVAVTKGCTVDAIRAAAALGVTAIGESYVQEALAKRRALQDAGLAWHFVGPLQANKTRDVAAHFDWVHGIDRVKIARRLDAQREGSPLQVCVQVNISGEASKAGCAPEAVLELCREVAALPHLALRGLMAIPAPGAADPRAPYRTLRQLFEALRAEHARFDTLSAGMSDDFEDAIAEGSTLVRIGSAIFGARPAARPPGGDAR